MVSGNNRNRGTMMNPETPQRGPCIRFEGITLELSSFSGLQFDFAKNGNLVLTCDAFSGTVTLKSATEAHPLCSAGSEAGSLGVLDADVGMDQMEIDMALSQLEQGDSPKSSSGMLFSNPSAMRQACEGNQDRSVLSDVKPDRSSSGDLDTTVNLNNSMNNSSSISSKTESSLAALVSPSNSIAENSFYEGATAQKRDATSAAIGAPSPPANTPSSKTTVSPDSASSKPKGKRPRRTPKDEPSPPKIAASRAHHHQHHHHHHNKESSICDNRIEDATATTTTVVVSSNHEDVTPSSCAAAAWIASTAPSTPGPLSRSAKATVVSVDGGVASRGGGGFAPMGRWGHSATMVADSKMLVLGGQADDDAHQATLGDLYKFDFATGSWSRPMNCDSIPRAWHTASFIAGKNLLVIFGGERTVDGCPECLDDIMVLDTDIDLLYPPAISGKSPTARSGHSAAIMGTDLVVFGGVRGRKWQNNVVVLDTERWHWRHPTIDGSTPAPRSYHSATVVGSLMVVFGGNNQHESFDKVHVLDASKSRWVWSSPEVVGAAPACRTGHSALLLPDGYTILVHGGWDPEDEGGVKNFGDAYLLDTRLWEWSRGPETLLGREEAGLRVGHTALLARAAGEKEGVVQGDGEGRRGGGEWKTAFFGGQDGGGVRRSELALLSL